MNIKDRIWCLGASGAFSCISCVLTPFLFPKAAKWDIMPPNGSDESQTLTSTDGQVRRNPHPSRGRLLDLPGEVLRLICAQLCHHCRSQRVVGAVHEHPRRMDIVLQRQSCPECTIADMHHLPGRCAATTLSLPAHQKAPLLPEDRPRAPGSRRPRQAHLAGWVGLALLVI